MFTLSDSNYSSHYPFLWAGSAGCFPTFGPRYPHSLRLRDKEILRMAPPAPPALSPPAYTACFHWYSTSSFQPSADNDLYSSWRPNNASWHRLQTTRIFSSVSRPPALRGKMWWKSTAGAPQRVRIDAFPAELYSCHWKRLSTILSQRLPLRFINARRRALLIIRYLPRRFLGLRQYSLCFSEGLNERLNLAGIEIPLGAPNPSHKAVQQPYCLCISVGNHRVSGHSPLLFCWRNLPLGLLSTLPTGRYDLLPARGTDPHHRLPLIPEPVPELLAVRKVAKVHLHPAFQCPMSIVETGLPHRLNQGQR